MQVPRHTYNIQHTHHTSHARAHTHTRPPAHTHTHTHAHTHVHDMHTTCVHPFIHHLLAFWLSQLKDEQGNPIPPSDNPAHYCSFCCTVDTQDNLLICVKCSNAGQQKCLKYVAPPPPLADCVVRVCKQCVHPCASSTRLSTCVSTHRLCTATWL
jgi:hypothetical protein